MTTDQMKYFLEAAKCQNFTLAAEHLYIAQSSLSRQILSLERELGVKLFDRNNNAVALTPAGRVLNDKLLAHYAAYLKIVKEVQDIGSGAAGSLSVGVQEDQRMNPYLLGAVRSLLQTNPNTNIYLHRKSLSTLHSNLKLETVDIALLTVHTPEHLSSLFHLDYCIVGSGKLHLAISSARQEAALASLTSEELAALSLKYPLYLQRQDGISTPIYRAIRAVFNRLPSCELSVRQELESSSTLSFHVATGLCITAVNPTHILSLSPVVTLIPIEDSAPVFTCLAWSPKNANPVIQTLLCEVRRQMEQEEPSAR